MSPFAKLTLPLLSFKILLVAYFLTFYRQIWCRMMSHGWRWTCSNLPPPSPVQGVWFPRSSTHMMEITSVGDKSVEVTLGLRSWPRVDYCVSLNCWRATSNCFSSDQSAWNNCSWGGMQSTQGIRHSSWYPGRTWICCGDWQVMTSDDDERRGKARRSRGSVQQVVKLPPVAYAEYSV